MFEAELVDTLQYLFVISTSFAAVYVLYTTLRLNLGSNRESHSPSRGQKFLKTLTEGRKRSLINTHEDVTNHYRGIFTNISDNTEQKFAMSMLLRMYLVVLSNEGIDDLPQENILEWKNMITQFIEDNEAVTPYEEIPAAERNILYDIRKYFGSNDIDMFERKLHELSGSIRARENTLSRAILVNKWTFPVSIIGLVLTIVFGLIAFLK